MRETMNRRTVRDRRSTWFRPTRPASIQLASDEEVRHLAVEALDALPEDLRYDVTHFLQGVFSGQQQPLEWHTTALHQAYAPVRRLIRRKYGPLLYLYRGEPATTPVMRREFLSWSPSQGLAARFAERRGLSVIEASVSVDDIVAVLVSPVNRAYIEYLVIDRPEYHTQRALLPMLGIVYLGHYYSDAKVAALTRALRRELWVVGGRIIRIKVNREDQYASATVLLPAEVVGDAHEMTIGEFQIEALAPYSRTVRETS